MSIKEIGHPNTESLIIYSTVEKLHAGEEKIVFLLGDKPEFVINLDGKTIRNPALKRRLMKVLDDNSVSLASPRKEAGDKPALIGDEINRQNIWVLPTVISNHRGHIVFEAPSSLYSYYPGLDDIPF